MKVRWQAAPFWLSGDQPRNYVSDCSATPDLLSRQHLEQDTAKCLYIRSLVGGFTPRLFWRHVRRCAENDSLLGGLHT